MKSKSDDSESIDDIEYPHITDIMMKDEITMGAPAVNRSNKTNALRIYEEKRNLNDVINEQKMLDDENSKIEQQLEDAEKSIRSPQVNTESEEYQRLTYRIMQLEADKKNQVSFFLFVEK